MLKDREHPMVSGINEDVTNALMLYLHNGNNEELKNISWVQTYILRLLFTKFFRQCNIELVNLSWLNYQNY